MHASPPRPNGTVASGHAHVLSREVLDPLRRGSGPVPVPLRGIALLADPILNKDTAFTATERDAFGLRGLLPAWVATIDDQVALALEQNRGKPDDLERYIGLAALQDRNETLFHRVLATHLEELLPIVYTPTVGRACQAYSHTYRRPRGVWITPDDVDRIPAVLRHAARDEIRLVVATDNERILGLGDQGAGGMPIPIGKLALYSAAAGIHPGMTLPVSLDVGTDRAALLDDPLYVGWRHPRLRGPDYDAVIEAFVTGLREVWPRAVLQWEDFKQHNALRLLDRYRERLCTFNDDIQGTAAVAVATVLAALQASGGDIGAARFVLAGAGAAGTGIARLLRAALADEGVDGVAEGSIAMLDSRGLVVAGRPGLDDDKAESAMPRATASRLGLDPDSAPGLVDVVRAMRPAVLLGTTGIGGAFGEDVLRAMAEGTSRPIVLPLSNPTANAEATPAEVMAWTGGRAIVATGSPFPAVRGADGRVRPVPQANNAYIFPGMGLAAIVAEARTLPDSAFLVAARALAALVPGAASAADAASGADAALLPPIAELRSVARAVAVAVVRHLAITGDGRWLEPADVPGAVDAAMWTPRYVPYVPAPVAGTG